jgi:hypothetical protein
MKRRNKIAVATIAAILAFIFFVPIAQVNFVQSPSGKCTYTDQQSFLCSLTKAGHASITYWLFGYGGTYGTWTNSGYGVVM